MTHDFLDSNIKGIVIIGQQGIGKTYMVKSMFSLLNRPPLDRKGNIKIINLADSDHLEYNYFNDVVIFDSISNIKNLPKLVPSTVLLRKPYTKDREVFKKPLIIAISNCPIEHLYKDTKVEDIQHWVVYNIETQRKELYDFLSSQISQNL